MHEASNTLYQLDAKYQWTATTRNLESPASSIVSSNNGILATLMGSDWQGSWVPQGALVRFAKDKTQTMGGALHRPTDILPLDLNKDGREDLVITEHGNILGKVFWLEKLKKGNYG